MTVALYALAAVACVGGVGLVARSLLRWWASYRGAAATREADKAAARARAAADEVLAKAGRSVDEADARAQQEVDDARRSTLADWLRDHGAGR